MPIAFDGVDETYDASALQRFWKSGGIFRAYTEKPAIDLYGGEEVITGRADLNAHVRARLAQIGLTASLLRGECYRRSGGGGGVYLHFDDGRNPALPVAPGARILWTRAYDTIELRAEGQWIDRDPMSRTYMQPLVWTHYALTGGVTHIHPSRLIIMAGPTVSNWDRWEHQGWGFSGLATVVRKVSDLDIASRSTLNAMADCSVGVLGVHELGAMVSKADAADAISRLRNWKRGISSARVGILDAEKETFTRVNAPLTGHPEVLLVLMRLVSTWCEIPMSILFGETPAGLSATGDNDTRKYYKGLAGEQKTRIAPEYVRVAEHLIDEVDQAYAGTPTVEFDPLWEPTSKEMAEERYLTAQTDQIYVDMQPSVALQILKARFGGTRYSTETRISPEWFEAQERARVVSARPRPSPPVAGPGAKDSAAEAAPAEPEKKAA